MVGTCDTKTAKADSEEILVFVSNLASDIARDEGSQDGSLSTPYSDLQKAINSAAKIAAPYSENSDGSLITIRIALFTGDHYMIVKDYDHQTEVVGDKSMHFKIHISPYFCSLENSPDVSKCVADEESTTNVYVKIGYGFSYDLPEHFYISNIVFDFTDSIITQNDDPQGCLSLREQCCIFDTSGGEALVKADDTQIEPCELRRKIRLGFYAIDVGHFFHLPNIDELNNAIANIPELVLEQTTF